MRKILVMACLLVVACSGGDDPPITSSSSSSSSSSSTTSAPAVSTFEVSASDFVEQLNLQLVLLSEEPATPLPDAAVSPGLFGGKVTSDTDIFVQTDQTAFDEVQVATVRVSNLDTPARLLAGVGASLQPLDAGAVAAFDEDALPRLGEITSLRTTITVGDFYALTVIVINDQSGLAFVWLRSLGRLRHRLSAWSLLSAKNLRVDAHVASATARRAALRRPTGRREAVLVEARCSLVACHRGLHRRHRTRSS